MTEGYYEEPMKWTMRNNTYENQRRDAELDYRETRPPKAPKLEKFYRLYELPKITNATILLVTVASSVISLICLVVLVQSSQESKNDFSTIRRILSEVKNNITATKTPPAPLTTMAAPEFPNNDTCRVYYKEKCFRLVSWTSNLTLTEAQDECTKVSGELANLYDYNHFEQISKLLKDSLPDDVQTLSAWTGMTVDTKTDRVFLSDFITPSGGIPWYPGRLYAFKLPSLTVRIRNTKSLYARGLYDARSGERLHTAICETAKEPCPD